MGASYPTIYATDLNFEIGKAISLHEGNDVTILATGILVHDALVAAEGLLKDGIKARVLDIHTIKPLDEEAVLSAARETGALVTVEDANILGGLGRSRCGIDLREMSCFHQEGRGQRSVRRIGESRGDIESRKLIPTRSKKT